MNLCIFIVVVCGVSATATASAASMREKLHSLSSLLIELQDKPTQDDVDRLADLAPKLQVAAQLALQERDEHDMTRLHHAVVQQDIPRLNTLLRLGLDIEAASGPMGVRPIHMSVLAEQTGCLERLLEAGASPDAPDAHGTTPLHAASTLNLPHVAEILLDSGASPEARGPKGARPLQLAAWSNAAEAADVLLRNGASVDATDKKRRTACHAAAAADAPEALEVLLASGANAEKPDARGRRALHYAVHSCACNDPACPRVRTLALLLEHGAQLNAQDAGGWSALDVAAEHNRLAPLQLLLRSGADANGQPSPSSCPPLVLAAHAGAREAVAMLLSAGALIDARDAFGATALHAACVGSHPKTVKFLMQAGAQTSVYDEAGRTPAHYAARSGCVKCLRALYKGGADLTPSSDFGWSALHVAANHSHPSAASVLLELGCKPSQPDAVGWTPLHLAAHRLGEGTNGCRCKRCIKLHDKRLECVRTLLRAESATSTSAADNIGATPAHLAAAHDDVEVPCTPPRCVASHALPKASYERVSVDLSHSHVPSPCLLSQGLRLLRHVNHPNLWLEDHEGQRPIDVARRMYRPSKFVRELLLLGDELQSRTSAGEVSREDEGAGGVGNRGA